MNEIQEIKNSIEALQIQRKSLQGKELETIDVEIAILQDSIQRKSLAAHQQRNQTYPVPTDSK